MEGRPHGWRFCRQNGFKTAILGLRTAILRNWNSGERSCLPKKSPGIMNLAVMQIYADAFDDIFFNSMMFNVTFQVLHLWTEVLGLLCMPFLRSRDSVSGTDFVAWARAAETSMMPSFFDRTCLFKNNQGIIKGVGLSQKASNLETQNTMFRDCFE